MKALLAASLMVTLALAGCASDDGPVAQENIPGIITQEELNELEARLLEAHPREFSFPGQTLAEPVVRVINDTLSAGTGVGVEPIDDDSVADAGGTIVSHDISDMVPTGQPIELRIALKWWGDPGASADMDIYVNVPGTQTTYSNRDEESWNWAIINKQMVVNTAKLEGEPFEVGMQVTNGKIVHPEGMKYSLTIEAHFIEGVVTPFTPWKLTMPEGGNLLIIESEPVVGDEHVSTEMVIVGPTGNLHRVVVHNDIGTETLSIPATLPGEYIVYVAHQQGGFVRIEADIPNENFLATPLQKVVTETVVASGALMAPAVPGTYAQTGAIETGGSTPLDVQSFIRPTGPGAGVVNAQMDILSDGIVHSTVVQGTLFSDEYGRIGGKPVVTVNRAAMTADGFQFGFTGNVGLNAEAGYTVVGYA